MKALVPQPTPWQPDDWQHWPALHQPAYPDPAQLGAVLTELAQCPPLVTSWEIEALKHQLGEAAQGERFLLQGGDCAERFSDCRGDIIASKLKILLQMSLVLLHGCKKRIIRVGRFAGQYAKPRSAPIETREGMTLPSYRGDLINEAAFTEMARTPNPALLLQGYQQAALTLNFIRALSAGGFADLHYPEQWDLDFVSDAPHAQAYHRIAEGIAEAVRFMEVISNQRVEQLNQVEFFTSHEGLHLHYEQAQTRRVPRRTGWYNLSTHFPWIGNRTRGLDGAHIAYFRGIENPIGVKIGADLDPQDLLRLIDVLNPANEPGRLTLVHRFGAAAIKKHLPPLIAAVQQARKTVLWCCDPMHGNTEITQSGLKTRKFDNILEELDHAFSIHASMDSWLGGVHVELTGENVTECIGGARGLAEADLEQAYHSQVDPRLNYEQALELALLIAGRMAQ